MTKFLVAGLGNIGPEYGNTRHNIGFRMLDFFAKRSGIFFSQDRYASVAEVRIKGKKVTLIKPSTFMNLSGKALHYWMQKEHILHPDILVVTDDLALPFGTLRMRLKGSDGGHNGLKSINEILGHSDYPRLRFGIGSDFQKGSQVNYVLSEWSLEESSQLEERIAAGCEMITSFVTTGAERTMSLFNNR